MVLGLNMIAKQTTIKGRQLVHMVLDHLKMNKAMAVIYTFQDLVQVKWMGDKEVQKFYTTLVLQ